MAIAAPFPAARVTPRSAPRKTRHITIDAGRARSGAARGGGRAGTAGEIRLTRRGRLVIGVLSVLALLTAVMLSGRLSADAGTSLVEQGRATGVVVVQPGESLWQIAQAVAPSADPRETVTAIRELNGIGDTTVVAGQSIIVPVVRGAGA
jgi:hypothetical protein